MSVNQCEIFPLQFPYSCADDFFSRFLAVYDEKICQSQHKRMIFYAIQNWGQCFDNANDVKCLHSHWPCLPPTTFHLQFYNWTPTTYHLQPTTNTLGSLKGRYGWGWHHKRLPVQMGSLKHNLTWPNPTYKPITSTCKPIDLPICDTSPTNNA